MILQVTPGKHPTDDSLRREADNKQEVQNKTFGL